MNAALVLVSTLSVVSSCTNTSPSAPDSRGLRDPLQHLRALPYLAWTEDRVEGLPSGITAYDRKQAFDGYNLFANERDRVYLMDMQGNTIHSWHLPGKGHCEYAELLESGEILVDCEAQALVKLSWRSEVIWQYRGYINHDIAVREDGSILVPLKERPRRYGAFRKVIFDAVLQLSANGKLLSKWSTFDHLRELQRHHSPHALDKPHPRNRAAPKKEKFEYYHLNTIKLLPETPLGRRDQRFRAGNYLLCFRNTDLIVILDQDTRQVVWSWGPGVLQRPHMPTMLSNGNILLFDNGCCGRNYSRVIELDPVSLKIQWEYAPNPPEHFYSAIRGGCQRLPNGNTLICESERGRVFEVTRSGEIVWEFWNPELLDGRRKRIYRMTRLSRKVVDDHLQRARQRAR